MVHALKIAANESADAETAMAWDLLDRESIERDMTNLVRAGLAAAHGIAIPAEPEVEKAQK